MKHLDRLVQRPRLRVLVDDQIYVAGNLWCGVISSIRCKFETTPLGATLVRLRNESIF
jgi:hypothetical protein